MHGRRPSGYSTPRVALGASLPFLPRKQALFRPGAPKRLANGNAVALAAAMLRVAARQPAPPAAGCVSAVCLASGSGGGGALLAYGAGGAAVVAPLGGDGGRGAPRVLRPPPGGPGADVAALAWAPEGSALAVAAGCRVDVHAPEAAPPAGGPAWRHAGAAEAPAPVLGARPNAKRMTLLSRLFLCVSLTLYAPRLFQR